MEPNNCAAKAGIKVGDIITGMGGYDVAGNSDLLSILRKFKPGDTTTITVFRSGREFELTITLDEKPAPTVAQPQSQTGTEPTAPSNDSQMPQDGDVWDWFNDYFWNNGR